MPTTGPDYDSSSAVSRRTLIKTAAGVGIAVAVAGTVGVANAGASDHGHAAANALAGGAPLAEGVPGHGGGTVVVHIIDRHAGTIEKFADGTRTQVRDADLAGRITRVASGAPVVVHVMDARSGTLDVFSDGAHARIRNADLAGRIVRAS